MRLLFLGDSITQGVGASCEEAGYVKLVGKKMGCEALNYGVSGTRIGRQSFIYNNTLFNYDFLLRAQVMVENADKVFVFGGTNDYGHGTLHLGTPENKAEDSFCNHLRRLIEYLCGKYGKEKLCFILPLHRFCEHSLNCKGEAGNEPGATLAEYVEAMRVILKEYGIDIIDLYDNGIPKPQVEGADEYTVDGLHPNDKGNLLIAERVCEYLSGK